MDICAGIVDRHHGGVTAPITAIDPGQGDYQEPSVSGTTIPSRLRSARDFNLKGMLIEINGYQYHESMNQVVKEATVEAYGVIRTWIEGYVEAERYPGEGWRTFAEDWRIVRMFVPLQFRLCAEQVLYDKGLPWRTMVSGFRPLKDQASAAQTF